MAIEQAEFKKEQKLKVIEQLKVNIEEQESDAEGTSRTIFDELVRVMLGVLKNGPS